MPKQYTDHFKSSLVALSATSNTPIAQLARLYGVPYGVLMRWKNDPRYKASPEALQNMIPSTEVSACFMQSPPQGAPDVAPMVTTDAAKFILKAFPGDFKSAVLAYQAGTGVSTREAIRHCGEELMNV